MAESLPRFIFCDETSSRVTRYLPFLGHIFPRPFLPFLCPLWCEFGRFVAAKKGGKGKATKAASFLRGEQRQQHGTRPSSATSTAWTATTAASRTSTTTPCPRPRQRRPPPGYRSGGGRPRRSRRPRPRRQMLSRPRDGVAAAAATTPPHPASSSAMGTAPRWRPRWRRRARPAASPTSRSCAAWAAAAETPTPSCGRTASCWRRPPPSLAPCWATPPWTPLQPHFICRTCDPRTCAWSWTTYTLAPCTLQRQTWPPS